MQIKQIPWNKTLNKWIRMSYFMLCECFIKSSSCIIRSNTLYVSLLHTFSEVDCFVTKMNWELWDWHTLKCTSSRHKMDNRPYIICPPFWYCFTLYENQTMIFWNKILNYRGFKVTITIASTRRLCKKI